LRVSPIRSLNEGEVSQIEVRLGCVSQNAVVFTDAALQLSFEVVTVVGVAVVSDPHLGHPLDMVFNLVALGKGAVTYFGIFSCEATFTLECEFSVIFLHVVASLNIGLARIWVSYIFYFFILFELNFVDSDAHGSIRICFISISYT
jgi:hypothetical protein